MILKFILSGVLFVIVIIAGLILHRTGKPYPALLFNIHKIITIAWIVVLSAILINCIRETEPHMFLYIVSGITLLAVLALLFSGGMMSLDKSPAAMLWVHRVSTGVVLVGFPVLLYMISILKH